jgi:Glycosyl hydrolases family 35.
MQYVERYLTYVMTSVQAQLYGNGGPIIMVQVRQLLIIYIMNIPALLH